MIDPKGRPPQRTKIFLMSWGCSKKCKKKKDLGLAPPSMRSPGSAPHERQFYKHRSRKMTRRRRPMLQLFHAISIQWTVWSIQNWNITAFLPHLSLISVHGFLIGRTLFLIYELSYWFKGWNCCFLVSIPAVKINISFQIQLVTCLYGNKLRTRTSSLPTACVIWDGR